MNDDHPKLESVAGGLSFSMFLKESWESGYVSWNGLTPHKFCEQLDIKIHIEDLSFYGTDKSLSWIKVLHKLEEGVKKNANPLIILLPEEYMFDGRERIHIVTAYNERRFGLMLQTRRIDDEAIFQKAKNNIMPALRIRDKKTYDKWIDRWIQNQ